MIMSCSRQCQLEDLLLWSFPVSEAMHLYYKLENSNDYIVLRVVNFKDQVLITVDIM